MCSATLGNPDGFAMPQIPASAWARLLVVAALVLGAAPAAQAQGAPGVYTVSDIPVDVSASDAVTARRQAVVEGQREGLARLFRRLVPEGEIGRLPPVGSLPLDTFVRNFSVSDEELSGTRYLARLTVAYDQTAVRELMQREGIPFAEVTSEPLLVLPLYEGPDGARLWADDNPWWQAWQETLDQERLLRLVLPLGDLEDMALVDLAQVRAGDLEALSALAARYGSEDVLIVTAGVPPPDTVEVPLVRLEARRVGQVERVGEPFTLRAAPDQDQEELLAEAVRRLQDSLDERWKEANLLRFDQAGLMVVDIPISELAEWVRINQGLQALPEVSQIDIATFARDLVRAHIRYIGDEVGLEDALLRLGLMLSREGETWQLLPTGGSRGPLGPESARSMPSSPAPR
jgi:hypothetical protein